MRKNTGMHIRLHTITIDKSKDDRYRAEEVEEEPT